MAEKNTERKVEVIVADQMAPITFLANRYAVERDGNHYILHFGFRKEAYAATATVAVSLSHKDLQQQKEAYKKYVEQISVLLDHPPAPERSSCRGYAPQFIQTANLIEISRLDNVGELLFSTFALHRLIMPPKGSESKLAATPILMVRCELKMQLDLICELLEAENPQ